LLKQYKQTSAWETTAILGMRIEWEDLPVDTDTQSYISMCTF